MQQYNSPSYLLLNNWDNQSIWVVTGVPIPNPQLNGFPIFNTSVRNIYVSNKGILNVSLNINIETKSAFLNLNNTIILVSNKGNISVLMPPKTPYVLLLLKMSSGSSIIISSNTSIVQINRDTLLINESPQIFIYTNTSYKIEKNLLNLSINEGKWFVELSIGNIPNRNISNLIKLNDYEVSEWLNASKLPKLPHALLREYYLSLLLIKDDQNPYLGTFAASPSPIYLYSWIRDSAFSAIALQDAGHYQSALKFWLWMSNAVQIQPGVWYTRYNFYNGQPDTSFGIDELDSIGLFELGVYNYYILTNNITFLKQILPTINKSVEYQITEINQSKYHLLPPDLSVWEDRNAYHFWTEAINDIGLESVIKIYEILGINDSSIVLAERELNESILNHFWNNNYFASALGTSVIFENGKNEIVLSPEPPSIDAATLLPIDLGYLSLSSNYSVSNFNTVVSDLNRSGGLARFPDDLYHYSEYLYDSSGPEPPWIITTLFEALYLEKIGKVNEALNILYWTYDHSQNGLLPEALDPNTLYPLPTTSPLTWSSAMFVIDALNYPSTANNETNASITIIILLIVIVLAVIIITLFMTRRRRK
ncbi:glycoside hydrolase [Sulfolobus tengchongensis]|uniref:Glycoside hydrolase n=1 Tax=Sulfolobus tengchongensis TaxID=207809 RepID=A0AAX4L270_9CREN